MEPTATRDIKMMGLGGAVLTFLGGLWNNSWRLGRPNPKTAVLVNTAKKPPER